MTPLNRGKVGMKFLFQIMLVACGSSLGGLARWGVGTWVGRWIGGAFPWGTLVINITGCLFLGWLMTTLGERLVFRETSWFQSDDLRLLLAVGFTGAYTTFSTFEYETDILFRNGDLLAAMTYMAGSVFAGLLAIRAGILLGS